MSRNRICAGNWKLHKTPEETKAFLQDWQAKANNLRCLIVIFPPAYNLPAMNQAEKTVQFGPQNIYFENQGAFTGEISPAAAKSIGAAYALIGHSERRTLFGENDDMIAKKVKTASAEGLVPMLCVGETLVERKSGKTTDVVLGQLKKGLSLISGHNPFVIAYEPVWAIGTGEVATPDQAEEVHCFIRETLKVLMGDECSDSTPILYGGSVKPDNAEGLAAKPNIDGFLVGGASLKVTDFFAIAQALEA